MVKVKRVVKGSNGEGMHGGLVGKKEKKNSTKIDPLNL